MSNAIKVAVLLLLSGLLAAPTGMAQSKPEGGFVYGWQLMTEQERQEHREHMRSARSEAERSLIRLEHHRMMRDRAAEQGVMLPCDACTQRGRGKRSHRGWGSGKQ